MEISERTEEIISKIVGFVIGLTFLLLGSLMTNTFYSNLGDLTVMLKIIGVLGVILVLFGVWVTFSSVFVFIIDMLNSKNGNE